MDDQIEDLLYAANSFSTSTILHPRTQCACQNIHEPQMLADEREHFDKSADQTKDDEARYESQSMRNNANDINVSLYVGQMAP